MRIHAGHALYIHCACHRLQLASMQAASSVPEVKKLFGMMTNLWKLFYYSPKNAEALEEIQIVLNLPQLKVVKPSGTHWLSHECCIRARPSAKTYQLSSSHSSNCMKVLEMPKLMESALFLQIRWESQELSLISSS